MKALLAILVTLGMSGCATYGGFRKNMNSWIGAPIDSVVMTWGPPSSTFDMQDGWAVYTWDSSNAIAMTNPMVGGGYMTGIIEASCTKMLTVDDKGIVKSWRSRGNNCVE